MRLCDYAPSFKRKDLLQILRRQPDPDSFVLAQNAPHSVTFTLNEDDFVQAERRWITHEYLTRTARGCLVMVGLIPFAYLVVMSVISALSKSAGPIAQNLPLILLSIILSVTLAAVTVAIHVRMVRLRQHSEPGHPRTVRIDSRGIAETYDSRPTEEATSDPRERLIPWESVREATLDRRQIYIRYDRGEVLIPRRAFLGGGHLEGFLTLIAGYRARMEPLAEESWPRKPAE